LTSGPSAGSTVGVVVGTRTDVGEEVGDEAGSLAVPEPADPDEQDAVDASTPQVARTANQRRFPREVMPRP
jgi:hypothetical protein